MFIDGEEKGILRKAFEDFLPEDIAHRKKNPYPKTHSPVYSEFIQAKLKESLDSMHSLIKINLSTSLIPMVIVLLHHGLVN